MYLAGLFLTRPRAPATVAFVVRMPTLPARPQRLLSLTLALLVLAASLGLPVQRRTCRISGRSTARIAWGTAKPGATLGQRPSRLAS